MRTVLVLVSCLSFAASAFAADNAKPIVPSINDVIPTLPTVTVTSPAPYLKPSPLVPSDPAHATETTPAWAAPWLPADLAAPISHAKSPHEIDADKAFDDEKDTNTSARQRSIRRRRVASAAPRCTAIAKATSISCTRDLIG